MSALSGAHYLLDFDPARPSGTAATAVQREQAAHKANEVEAYLTGLGWPQPVRLDSGNGTHLVYPGDRCSPHTQAWPKALTALSRMFSDEVVKVDQVVHNPARIARMPYTHNRKAGRLAGIIFMPEAQIPVTEQQIVGLMLDPGSEPLPEHRKPKISATTGSYSLAIDRGGVYQLIAEYPGILGLHEIEERGDATYFHLAECPFAGRVHRGTPGSTAIIVGKDTLGFKCFSDDCAHYTMFDLRRLLHHKTGRSPSMPFWIEHIEDVDTLSAMWGGPIDEGSGIGLRPIVAALED